MKSTMQAKPNKSPDRLDYREPTVNFPRKYFWARKTCWFIVTETFPGDEQIPYSFQRRKSPWKPDCLPSSWGAEMDVPHVGTTSGTGARPIPWGGTRWALSRAHLRSILKLPWKPRSVTCSVLPGSIFAFERWCFKSVSARSNWLFPGQQKYQNST